MRAAAVQIDRSKYEIITSPKDLEAFLDDAWHSGALCVDTETTGLDVMKAELVGVALATRPGKAAYVPLMHQDGTAQISLSVALQILEPYLSCPILTKVGLNYKYDHNIFQRYGIQSSGVEDAMLMAYSMFGGKHYMNMDALSAKYLGHTTIKFKQVAGAGTFDAVPVRLATDYAAEDADVTLRLAYKFEGMLGEDPDAARVYTQLEQPLVPIIADMERRGIAVSPDTLKRLGEEFSFEMAKQLGIMEGLAGEFNPGSPQQVGAKLDAMGVKITEETDSGQMATGVKVLTEVLEKGDVPEKGRALITAILEWRKYAKLKGTYADALVAQINPSTGRIHPSFVMAGTTTGRLACAEPNLQNVPFRTEEGRQIRSAFVAAEGHKLISADYSQLELRILTHAAGDEAMFVAFEQGHDFHAATASEVWGVPLDKVTTTQRRNAKDINFGVVYGISAWGMARKFGVSKGEAQGIIDRYFAKFPGVKTYMDRAKKMAQDTGYVQTLFGRKVWFPNIKSFNDGWRGHAERGAVNAPIQGTGADIVKAAMIKVDRALKAGGFTTRMLLQVHDELVFEAPDAEVTTVLPLIKTTMEKAVDYLDVPLIVDAKAGANWLEAH